ncbi:MAG TPA: EAL domain-containing protein, partial [Burkholderiaceae bacterium]|nr:EAL domain-containing protein [Burkholderiaceae bacterium]
MTPGDRYGEVQEYAVTGTVLARARVDGLEHLTAIYAVLNATNEAILRSRTAQELYQHVCNAAVDGGKFKIMAICLPDPETTKIRVAAIAGTQASTIDGGAGSDDEKAVKGESLVGTAFRSGAPCLSNDFLADGRTRPWHAVALAEGVAAGAAVPLTVDDQPLGVLLFYSTEKHAFDEETVRLIERMSRNISFALVHFSRETERRQAEQALRESEARFRALTNLSSDWYWELDPGFRYSRMEGRRSNVQSTQNAFLGRLIWDTELENQNPGGWDALREEMAAHKPFRDVTLHRLLPNGSPYYISASAEPVFTDGRFAGYRGVSREITHQKIAEQRIEYLATHDALTALPNRVMFSQLLNSSILSARRYDRRFALMFIDLDRFKFVNDTLGHEAGDSLLQEITMRFRHALRASDVLARLGGDEFVLLVQEANDEEDAAAAARKILSAAIKPFVLAGQECRVTASIGVAMFPTHGEDEAALMKNADSAMYFAKEQGKNNVQFYSADIQSHSLERLSLETHLRHALERGEFSLRYQAKVDLRRDVITGVEALLRWENPELGFVSPNHFIPIAEETGLIIAIGRWVLRTACEQNMAWQRQGLPATCIAVNLSPRQFANDMLLHDIAEVLQETGMPPHQLELEITEGMVIGDTQAAIELLTAIKRLGVRLAIDDFGTGYSSLGQLKNFPIDTLKVDRSFIRDIVSNTEDRAITEAIIAIGKTLSLTVIAEGVETAEQEAFLRSRA